MINPYVPHAVWCKCRACKNDKVPTEPIVSTILYTDAEGIYTLNSVAWNPGSEQWEANIQRRYYSNNITKDKYLTIPLERWNSPFEQ